MWIVHELTDSGLRMDDCKTYQVYMFWWFGVSLLGKLQADGGMGSAGCG